MRVITKDPDAVKDYVWDWTTFLNGRTISEFEFVIPEGISVLADPAPEVLPGGTQVLAWVSGGSPNNAYDVACRVKAGTGPFSEDKSIRFMIKQT